MPPRAELPDPILANLTTIEELDRSLDAKGTANPGDGLYPRDGAAEVTDIEEAISQITIPGHQQNIIWATGMSAVRETVNFAAIFMAEQGTRGGEAPIVAHATNLYAQSAKYFANEKIKGLKVIRFDSGNAEDLNWAVEAKNADVLFAETVANTPDLPVLNVHKLLEHVRRLKKPPILILDNTLPLSTGIDFDSLLEEDDPVIIVESGTKNLMNNSESLGVSYSANTELIDALRRHKAHSGAINSLGALVGISNNLTASLPGFHIRNRSVFRSTSLIAEALAEAQSELGETADFSTVFPTNPDHPNYDYATDITTLGFGFISPVAFIVAKRWDDDGVAKLTRRITEHPAVRAQIKEGEVYLGQSFGLPKARILYDRAAPNVRFAGGFELADEVKLAAAIKEAAADI